MTAAVDEKGCIKLPSVEPGKLFDVQMGSDGEIILKPFKNSDQTETKKSRIRFETENGYFVAVLDHPINEEALNEALRELP